MPSVPTASRLRTWLTCSTNVAIFASIVVAIPASYLADAWFPGGDAVSFLVLLAVGVGVPTIYDAYGPTADGVVGTVAWVFGVAVASALFFFGLFVVAVRAGLSPFRAAVATFLVVELGGTALAAFLSG
jgi:hypothetical protein